MCARLNVAPRYTWYLLSQSAGVTIFSKRIRFSTPASPTFSNCFKSFARNAGASFDQSTFGCRCVTGASTYSVLIPAGASPGSVTLAFCT